MLSKKSKVNAEQAILDAASELFLQRGFKSVSIGEIMQEAACSRETIYRYFSGSEVNTRPEHGKLYYDLAYSKGASAGAGQSASGNKREDRYVKAGSPFI